MIQLTSNSARPRLLYFNGPWDYIGERIRHSYIDPFRRLLEQDFEVVSVEGNRDFRHEVQTHRPDVVLFHTGCEAPGEPEVTITNPDAFPEIPRMGYMFRDPFSPSRLSSMNRMKAWKVDQVFADFRASDCPVPFFDNSIYLPWWVEDAVFRDYEEPKSFPITLTGSGWLVKAFYTWRFPVFAELIQKFPVYHVPAFETHQKSDAYTGESYARLLNRSLISAGCGTFCRYLTLKLLEIPASRCCLLAEESEVLKAIGFVDGVNCVFADPKNVASKVQALLDDPARLQSITDAGYELVHRRHTRKNRRMFAEWYQLWRTKQPGQRILQVNPLEPLELVADNAALTTTFPGENPLRDHLVAGYRLIGESRWAEAAVEFSAVIAVIKYTAEARLGMAICELNQSRPQDALSHMENIFHIETKLCGFKRPDPLSVAYAAIVLVRLNQAGKAMDLLAKHAAMKHPALNALRWVAAELWPRFRQKYPQWQTDDNNPTQNTETVHLLPAQDFAGWAEVWTSYLNPDRAVAANS